MVTKQFREKIFREMGSNIDLARIPLLAFCVKLCSLSRTEKLELALNLQVVVRRCENVRRLSRKKVI